MASNITEFHAHLDECKQCRDNPFDLCEAGQRISTGANTETKGDRPKNLVHAITRAAGYEKPEDDPVWRLAADLMDG